MAKISFSQEQLGEILKTAYEKATKGLPGMKTAEEVAEEYLEKYPSKEKAISKLVNTQIAKCSTSGFLTGLGGLITLPVAIPANIGSVLYVQLRMIASIAYIGGYDPCDDQVQTLAYVCLTNKSVAEVFEQAGVKIGEKLAANAIKKIPSAALTKINQAVGFRLVTKFGQTGVVNLGKAVPAVGGFVGAGFDYFTTRAIAKKAYKTFILNDFGVTTCSEDAVLDDGNVPI